MIKIGNLSINGSGVDIYIDESDDFSQKYENIKNIKEDINLQGNGAEDFIHFYILTRLYSKISIPRSKYISKDVIKKFPILDMAKMIKTELKIKLNPP